MSEEIKDLLSKPWQKFFARFDEIETIKVSQWKEVHVLAYICQRFEETYGRKFPISTKTCPSKSVEMYQTKQILVMLDTTNMRTVKEYIDWVYNKKVITKRSYIKKIGFFLTPAFINEFYFDRKNIKIKRSTVLPPSYKRIADSLEIPASTYGDLAFIKMAADQDKNNSKYVLLFANLEAVGLDLNMLKDISE